MFVIKRGFSVIMLIFFFFIINALVVSALGVSPGRVVLKFEPNQVYEKDLCFRPEGNPHLEIDKVGELAQYITLEEEEIFIEGEWGCIKYTLEMPASFDKPGKHTANIRGAEIPPGGVGMFVARVRINHQIWVLVPYPGKYLEIDYFRATNVEAGEEVAFEAGVTSKGNQTINNAKGLILIYDKDKKLVGSVETNIITGLGNEEKGTLYASWDSGNNVHGNYEAALIVAYNGEKSNATTNFKLGGLDVELLNYTREVFIGGIRPFYLLVESIWSEDIPNLKAIVSVLDNNSNEITSFETLTKNLPAWGGVTLDGYLDTQPLSLGTYDTKMTLFFEDLTKEYDGLINITEEPEEEPETKEKSRILTIKTVMIILIILIVIMLVVLVYILIPKKKKR